MEMKFVYLGKDGWPVELIEGRPVTNFIRLLIHTRRIVRNWQPPKPTGRVSMGWVEYEDKKSGKT